MLRIHEYFQQLGAQCSSCQCTMERKEISLKKNIQYMIAQ